MAGGQQRKQFVPAEAFVEAARRLGASKADAYWTASEELPVSFAYNRLESIQHKRSAAVVLRVAIDGRVGVATGSWGEAPEDLAGRAIEIARSANPGDLDLPPAAPLPQVETHDLALDALTPEQLVALGEDAIRRLRQAGEELQAGTELVVSTDHVALANSSGFSGSYTSGSAGVMVEISSAKETNIFTGYDGEEFGRAAEVQPHLRQMADRLAKLAQVAQRTRRPTASRYPVLLHPAAFANLMMPFVQSLNGRAVRQGVSRFRKDQFGSLITSEKLTLVDDPTLPYGVASAPFDDEGTPTQRNPLITAGKLSSFLLDRESAVELQMAPTGSAWRGDQPTAGPSNIVVEAGEQPMQDLLAGIEKGLYICALMGAWAGNPYAGQVGGTIAFGFWVEHGEPVARVTDAVFSLNLFRDLPHCLVALSSERSLGRATLPWALLDDVPIAAQ
ncbi:MAG: TldD/PmbA family protein [Firmicutes bacterium]|nr:TldD/PmbA family protein [Bacillota bacterium]